MDDTVKQLFNDWGDILLYDDCDHTGKITMRDGTVPLEYIFRLIKPALIALGSTGLFIGDWMVYYSATIGGMRGTSDYHANKMNYEYISDAFLLDLIKSNVQCING